MFYYVVLIFCLINFPQGLSDPRTGVRKYKPVIQVKEEIDVNDITFTTSVPEYDRSPSNKNINYYNKIKPDVKPTAFRVPETPPPSAYTHYKTPLPVDKVYSTGQPIIVPTLKYKQYKPYNQEKFVASTAYSKIKGPDPDKVILFDPPSTYSAIATPESPKQYSTKIVPFSSQYPPTKIPTKATYINKDKPFIPSPTFSPTVLAQIKQENNKKYIVDLPDIKESNLETKDLEWNKGTKNPYNLKKQKTSYEDESDNSERSTTSYKDSPQSESFLSEISTLHKGEGSPNNLDGVADSLDLKTGERVEFQMYGMDGPQSYKFGYDTGKGLNRHFRFEERDNTGKVKGHYGYLDEDGKMRIMKYEADPITGFHAGPVEISPDDN